MSRFIISILLSVFGLVYMQGQTLTSCQKNAKNEIFRYLKNKVSNISERQYNEIAFTYNGTQFLIDISDSDENPLFVTLSAGYNLPTYVSESAMAEAIKKTNFIKGAKAYVGDGFIVFESEMYFKKADDFSYCINI